MHTTARSGIDPGPGRGHLEGAGIFMLDEDHIACVLDLRITIMPESVMGFDKPVFSMRYEIAPVESPLEPPRRRRGNQELWRRWYFEVRDDLGTEYEAQSGASGFRGPSQTVLDSDIDFEPSVPLNATWIEVRFRDRYHPQQPVYTLRANLPLPPLPSAS